MLRFIKITILTAGLFCLAVHPVLAKKTVLTDIKVIHASTGKNHVDPGLNSIISELESVFKYTSYRLLKDETLNLNFGQKGQVNLPGKRTLEVVPIKMENKRIRYQILIRKINRIIFKTQVLLKNNSSITIGGPKFKKGTLLFNISGSAH